MKRVDFLFILLISGVAIAFVLIALDAYSINQEYGSKRTQCSEITHPELSVENEQRYNHCLSYPETYGIGVQYD
jgi:hypothetical protein